MNITEDYVSFEVAKILKEKGFFEKTFTYFDNELLCNGVWFEWNNSPMGQISAPTLQMAMKWLREVHNIIIVVEPHEYDYVNSKTSSYVFCLWDGDNYEEPYSNQHSNIHGVAYNSYEEVVEAALKYVLENLI